jgi:hypothetical protein
MAVSAFTLANLVVNTTDWAPIVAQLACQSFVINNMPGPDDLLLTHDPASNISTRIPVGNQWSLILSAGTSRLGDFWSYRFKAGDTCAYIKSTSASLRTVEVTFV